MTPIGRRIQSMLSSPALSVAPVVVALGLAIWLLSPADDAEKPIAARHIPADHDPQCPCCRWDALARKPQTPEIAEEIKRLAAECAAGVRYEGNIPVHPSKPAHRR